MEQGKDIQTSVLSLLATKFVQEAEENKKLRQDLSEEKAIREREESKARSCKYHEGQIRKRMNWLINHIWDLACPPEALCKTSRQKDKVACSKCWRKAAFDNENA